MQLKLELQICKNLMNWTEENPPWPSKTAAKEKPSRPPGLTRISSSISSRKPCKAMEPHLTPATSVKDEGVSMAMAEQHRPLLVVVKLFLRLLMLEDETPRSLVNRNLWICGLDNAIGEEEEGFRVEAKGKSKIVVDSFLEDK